MASAFDPYSEWLGIARQGLHPDRYCLLGLRAFEDNPDAISRAATAQIGRVQLHLQGTQAAAARRLLEELETARSCLLDPTRKQTYDAMLRQQLATRPKTAAAESPRMEAPASAPPAEAEVDDLLPPAAMLPPAAAAPQAMPVALPAGHPGQAYPAQAYPGQAYPGAVPMAAPAYPQAGVAVPLAAHAMPVQAYPAAPMARAVPAAGYAVPLAAPAEAYAGEAPFYGEAAVPLAEPMRLTGTVAASTSVARQARRRRRSTGIMLAVAVPVLLVVIVGVGAWALKEQGEPDRRDKPSEPGSVASSGRPRRAARTPYRSPRPQDVVVSPMAPLESPGESTTPEEMSEESASMPGEMPSPSEEPDMPAPTPQPAPEPESMPETAPAQEVDVAQALAAARWAMASRDLAAAARYLEAAAVSAEGDEEALEVARVTAVLGYVEEFWNAVAQSVKGLEAGMEFEYDGEPVIVVDNVDNVLSVRIKGESRDFDVEKLPTKLAVAIADHWLKKDDPASKLVVGAFLAVSPKGDREDARALWYQAGLLGLQEEADLVLPELDVKYPEEPMALALPSSAPTAAADGRTPPPADAEATAARDEVRQLYNDDYTAAKTPPEKALLADKLLTAGIDTTDNPARRYALLTEARDLGVEAGDASVVVRAIDALADLYSVDSFAMKAELLAAAAKATIGPEANAALARTALDLADEAVLYERIAEAKELVRTALGAARKSKDAELLQEASTRNTEVRALKSE
jgi:hypothetical protein